MNTFGNWAGALAFAGSVLLSCVASSLADELGELDAEHRLSGKLVTPHVKWARPYAKGPVRALFVVSGRGGDSGSFTQMGTKPREVVELAQRFDIKPDAVFLQSNILHMKEAGERRLKRLLRKSFHVYVLANASFDALPEESRRRIAERVQRGAGLVCVATPPPDSMPRKPLESHNFVHAGWPVAALPHARVVAESLGTDGPAANLAQRIVTLSASGRGRLAHINYGATTHALTPYMEFSFPALTEYEYWITFAGRVILWAAGREPDIVLEPVSGLREQFTRDALPRAITVAARGNMPASARLTFSFTLRRSDGSTARLDARAMGEGVARRVTIPVLPADRYFLDAVIRSRRGVETFASFAFEVTSLRGVESVSLEKPFIERGGVMRGEVTLRGKPSPTDRIVVALRDSYQRIVAAREFAAQSGGPLPFSLKIDESATMLMRAEATLLENGNEVETKQASFTVPHRRRGRFNFLMWDRPNDVLGYYAYQHLREAGMSVSLVGGAPGPVLEACDYAQVPYTTRVLDRFDGDGIMQPVCWNDEPAVQQWVESIVGKYLPSRQHGVFVYSLGDETTTKGACQHPACLEAYRRYLREQYSTIEALNASWGSSYQSFDQVSTLEKTDNYEEAAKKQGLFARWYDRNAFARLNFLRLCARFGRAYRELDPQAITGFEGAGSLGDDYEAIISTNGFWSPYPGVADEIIRSIAPRSFIRSNWMGYDKTAPPLIANAWRMVTMGYDSIWWWRWDGIGRYHGYLAPDLDFWPATAELVKEMRLVRNGLGDLLINSHMLHDGVAILYSPPSAAAGFFDPEKEFVRLDDEHQSLVSAVKDAGFQLRYITTGMLERGALDAGEFDVLVLPFSLALSSAQADAIRRFVEAGGLLIADLRPGLYDEHCKPRETGILDDLLGIRRAGPGSPKELNIDVKTHIADQPLAIKLTTKADAHIQPAGAEALAHADGVPILLTRRLGRGRTILLNFHIANYEERRHAPQADNTREFMAALCAIARVRPLLVQDRNAQPLRGVEVGQWRAGDALIVSLFRNPGRWRWTGPKAIEAAPSLRAKLNLPRFHHVYDLRRREYLGRTSRINASLRMGRAEFFALLPYRIPKLNLTVFGGDVRQGDWLPATLRVGLGRPAAVYAVHVEATTPEGKPTPWLDRVMILRGGSADFTIPVAVNDAQGTWRIRATELLSGQTVEASYRVTSY